MRRVLPLNTTITWPIAAHILKTWALADWPRLLIAAGLIEVWLLVLLNVPAQLPVQWASWLTFIALLVTPGYFLADIVAWKLNLDLIERLALALPLSVAIMALPGTIALVRHLTMTQLAAGWMLASAVVIVVWLVHGLWIRSSGWLDGNGLPPFQGSKWAVDEIILLALLAIAFILILPTLTIVKIDGDAYAVNSFSVDALAGLPLNKTEPIFGTTLGPGVRMVFNQFLAMSYLWAYLSDIDPNTLIAQASRPMIALWALFASYMLGKAAGNGSRRFGLYTVSIQLLVYLSAPFWRGDNVSLFYFERTNADKFMVPITMLPVIFALAIRYVRRGRFDTWLAAAIASFAVSTIHPLIAAMLALALGAFGAMHLALGVRSRVAESKRRPGRWLLASLKLNSATISSAAVKRVFALWALIVIVMALPIIQLVLSRGEAPLAASYPSSVEGWSVGEKLVPALPFLNVPTLDIFGPLPDLAQLEAADANTTTNPFLIWRMAVNINRQRLIMFNLQQYISDPRLILEPVYLLALLLLPLLFWRLRSNIGAQFAVSTTLAILFVMFNPFVTPLIGSVVMPWILWRFVWLFPYALIIAMATYRLITAAAKWLIVWLKVDPSRPGGGEKYSFYASLGFILLLSLALSPAMLRNIQDLNQRETSPFFYPAPKNILAYLDDMTRNGGPVTVLADSSLSVTLPAYVANAAVIAHRAPTTSEVFPADRQDEALGRLIDQDYFFRTPYLTQDAANILARYNVGYVVTPSGSDMDMQLRLASAWFEWLLDDQSFSLYQVKQIPPLAETVQGNTALFNRQWESATQFYQRALEIDPDDQLALIGLAEIDYVQGRTEEATAKLEQAKSQSNLPAIYNKLGELYAEQGDTARSLVEYRQAQQLAPQVSRFHADLGNACLNSGDSACAAEQYAAAAASQNQPDEASRLIVRGDLWRQQGRLEQAIPLYEQAAAYKPSVFNRFVLENAYRQAEDFGRAETLINTMWTEHPLSIEVKSLMAGLLAAEGKIDPAIAQYRRIILLQDLRAQETTNTRLALAQLLLNNNRLEEAAAEVEKIITLRPFDAVGYRLQGDLYDAQGDLKNSIYAYLRAFELDPNQIGVYISLKNQLRLFGGQDERILDLLQTATELNPDEATLFLALGDELEQVGQRQQAIDAYQSALDRSGAAALSGRLRGQSNELSVAFTHTRLGRAYEAMGQTTPALNHYQAAVSIVSDAPWALTMLGDAHRRNNNNDQAEQAYQRAIAVDPYFIDAYVGLAEIAIDQNAYDEADIYLRQAITADDQNERPYIRLGDLAELRGDYDRALDWYSQAASLSPTDETVNIALIDSLLRYGGADIALGYTEQALINQYGNSDLMLRLSRIQRTLGQNAPAENTLLAATEINKDDAALFTELAQFYAAQGQPQNAIDTYKQAIENAATEAAYYTGLSDILVSQGETAQALAALQDGLIQLPGATDIYIAMANLHRQAGNTDLSLQVLEQGIQNAGGNVPLQLALADYYASRGDFDQAQAELSTALNLQNDNAAVYAALADLSVQRGDAENALTFHEQALAFQPDNPIYLLALAATYSQLERPDDAIAAYNKAIAAAPGLDNAYISLARLYENEEQPDEARRAYEAGLAAAPNSINLLSLYGQFLMEQDAETSALSLVNRAAQAPATVSNIVARAGLYTALGQFNTAETELQAALQREPGSLNALIALGDLYRAQEDYAAAQQAYQQAVDLFPGVPTGYIRLGAIAGDQGDLVTAQDFTDAARAVEPGAFVQ